MLPAIWLWPHTVPWMWDGMCWFLIKLSPQTSTKNEMDISMNYVRLSTEHNTTMQNTTANDQKLSALAQMIIDRWCEWIQDVSNNFRKYQWSVSVLTVEDVLILHEGVLLIPPSEHDDILWCLLGRPQRWHQDTAACQEHDLLARISQRCRTSHHTMLKMPALPTMECWSTTWMAAHCWQTIGSTFWAWWINIPNSHQRILKDVIHVQPSCIQNWYQCCHCQIWETIC